MKRSSRHLELLSDERLGIRGLERLAEVQVLLWVLNFLEEKDVCMLEACGRLRRLRATFRIYWRGKLLSQLSKRSDLFKVKECANLKLAYMTGKRDPDLEAILLQNFMFTSPIQRCNFSDMERNRESGPVSFCVVSSENEIAVVSSCMMKSVSVMKMYNSSVAVSGKISDATILAGHRGSAGIDVIRHGESGLSCFHRWRRHGPEISNIACRWGEGLAVLDSQKANVVEVCDLNSLQIRWKRAYRSKKESRAISRMISPHLLVTRRTGELTLFDIRQFKPVFTFEHPVTMQFVPSADGFRWCAGASFNPSFLVTTWTSSEQNFNEGNLKRVVDSFEISDATWPQRIEIENQFKICPISGGWAAWRNTFFGPGRILISRREKILCDRISGLERQSSKADFDATDSCLAAVTNGRLYLFTEVPSAREEDSVYSDQFEFAKFPHLMQPPQCIPAEPQATADILPDGNPGKVNKDTSIHGVNLLTERSESIHGVYQFQ